MHKYPRLITASLILLLSFFGPQVPLSLASLVIHALTVTNLHRYKWELSVCPSVQVHDDRDMNELEH